MQSTYNIYSIANKAVPFGPMGPWRLRSTSSIVCVCSRYTMGVFISFVCTLRTIRVIGGLFFGSEAAAAALYWGLALPYCICAYAEVSLTSWGDRVCI